VTSFRIAAQTRCLAQPLIKALHTVAATGCQGVQIDARHELRPAELTDTGLRHLRKVLNDLNLRVGSIAFPTHRGYADPVDLERRIEATQAALQLASRLEARTLICYLGRLPQGPPIDQAAQLREAVTALGQSGLKYGVQLAAQAEFDSCAQFADFLGSLPEGSLFLDLHPARLQACGIAVADYVSSLGQHIAHVHAVDSVRDFASGRGLEVELGRGSMDFPALLGQLEEHTYRGWITVERNGSLHPTEDIANAVRYLRAI
jgi:sugar phosphate isomerase/epimerase